MIYKGYVIEKETDPWAIKFGGNFKFYPEGGIDCHCETGGNWQSNVSSASTIEDAKEQIDEYENV